MPPSYESESFWNTRFKTETHFEWLGHGRETIIPVLQQHLLTHGKDAKELPTPRTLHIGAGTSTLSDAILQTYHDIYEGQTQMRDVVVNTDFAEEVVERGRQSTEAVRGDVRWEKVDLLSWGDCKGLVASSSSESMEGEELFEVVVDKSTSDAISCGEDVSFSKEALIGDREYSSMHPVIVQLLLQSQSEVPFVLEPLEVLALHLASLVKPGRMWIALSYSERRFPFLRTSDKGWQEGERDGGDGRERPLLNVSLFWEVERVEKVDAPSGGNAHAPVIQHHLYILRRTHRSVE